MPFVLGSTSAAAQPEPPALGGPGAADPLFAEDPVRRGCAVPGWSGACVGPRSAPARTNLKSRPYWERNGRPRTSARTYGSEGVSAPHAASPTPRCSSVSPNPVGRFPVPRSPRPAPFWLPGPHSAGLSHLLSPACRRGTPALCAAPPGCRGQMGKRQLSGGVLVPLLPARCWKRLGRGCWRRLGPLGTARLVDGVPPCPWRGRADLAFGICLLSPTVDSVLENCRTWGSWKAAS